MLFREMQITSYQEQNHYGLCIETILEDAHLHCILDLDQFSKHADGRYDGQVHSKTHSEPVHIQHTGMQNTFTAVENSAVSTLSALGYLHPTASHVPVRMHCMISAATHHCQHTVLHCNTCVDALFSKQSANQLHLPCVHSSRAVCCSST